MFGIGFTELLVLVAIVAILLGPNELPKVMKMLGKFAREIVNARDELKKSIDQDDTLRNVRDSVVDIKDAVHSPVRKFKSHFESEVQTIIETSNEDNQKKTKDIRPS